MCSGALAPLRGAKRGAPSQQGQPKEEDMSAMKIISIKSYLFWILCILIFGFSRSAAQVPKSENEIPILSGAVREADKEASKKDEMSWDQNPTLRKAVLKVYRTGASPEEVFGFYRQKIGGKEGSMDTDPMGIARGTVSQVWYEIDYYTDEDLSDYDFDGSKHPGVWMKQNLTKYRKPQSPGQWIKGARFNWLKKESNNDLTTFYIIIFDESFESSPEKYATAASIEIQVTTEKSEQAVRDESDAEQDRKTGELSESLRQKPPTAKDLGVPLYPGAKFDADNSSGMSAGNDYAIYIYLTQDQPSKVAAFFEKQLKITPVEVGNDQYMIPLKGQMPVPDEGISIQPNTMFGGSAKTVISIQKTTGGGR
jgi:hypothetical protein